MKKRDAEKLREKVLKLERLAILLRNVALNADIDMLNIDEVNKHIDQCKLKK